MAAAKQAPSSDRDAENRRPPRNVGAPSRVAGAVRALFAIALRPVLSRALGAFAAVGLASTVIFGPQGLRAGELVRAIHASPILRGVLWAGWLLLAAPASRAAFTAPGLGLLRVHARSKIGTTSGLILLLAAVQLPWIVLFARGGGPLDALSAALLAMAVEAAVVARSWLAMLGLAAALFDVPIVGFVLAPFAVRRAWVLAPEHRAAGERIRTRSTWPSVALLTVVHLLRLARMERSRVVIAVTFVALGGAGLLTLRQEDGSVVARALAVMAFPITIAAACFATPILASEKSIGPLLRTLRVRMITVLAAFLGAIFIPTTALAASAGIGLATARSPAAVLTGLSAWSIAISAVVGAWTRRHDRTAKRSSTTFAAGVVLVAIVAMGIALAAIPRHR
jgi:hypothetical protein